jgi:uncharacterized membrane protein YphA (DoxX/SURF4 family)
MLVILWQEMNMRVKTILLFLIRFVLGALFLYTGFIKIREPVAFAGSVAAYKLLPYTGNYLVAAILPWIEALSGLILISGYRIKSAVALLMLLNTIFMIALVTVIYRGLNIDCGCFRQGGQATSPWMALGRDIVIFVFLGILARYGCTDTHAPAVPNESGA